MITVEHLCNLIRGQAKSADLWVDQYDRYHDASSALNASLAIGKVSGIYNVLMSMSIDIPEDIQELVTKYTGIWDNLEVK